MPLLNAPILEAGAKPVAAFAPEDRTKDDLAKNGRTGVDGFQKGQRDFSVKADNHVKPHPKYDLDAPEKVYTNGVTAPNLTKTIIGGLTGQPIRIPDVNSGYCREGATLLAGRADGAPDQNEYRRKFALIVPSTNTCVEYDFWRILFTGNPKLQRGIGFHTGGILIDSPKLATDEDMLNFLEMFRREIFKTVDRVMTAEPEYIIMGMSAETFFGGWEGNQELKEQISDRCGLTCATGAEACKYALKAFGATKLAVLTPYVQIGDDNVVKFFSEIGANVVRIKGLKCDSATSIAHVTEEYLEECVREIDGPDVDCILQCGTNLSLVWLADRMEAEVGKPIIAINAAILWFALRENGITEKLDGCTRLLREF